jgi:hypothetical protein
MTTSGKAQVSELKGSCPTWEELFPLHGPRVTRSALASARTRLQFCLLFFSLLAFFIYNQSRRPFQKQLLHHEAYFCDSSDLRPGHACMEKELPDSCWPCGGDVDSSGTRLSSLESSLCATLCLLSGGHSSHACMYCGMRLGRRNLT